LSTERRKMLRKDDKFYRHQLALCGVAELEIGKNLSLLGFGSVWVLTKVRVRFGSSSSQVQKIWVRFGFGSYILSFEFGSVWSGLQLPHLLVFVCLYVYFDVLHSLHVVCRLVYLTRFHFCTHIHAVVIICVCQIFIKETACLYEFGCLTVLNLTVPLNGTAISMLLV